MDLSSFDERENGGFGDFVNSFNNCIVSQNSAVSVSYSSNHSSSNKSSKSSRRRTKYENINISGNCFEDVGAGLSFFQEFRMSKSCSRVKKRPKSCVPGMRKSGFAKLSRVLEIYDQKNTRNGSIEDNHSLMMNFDPGVPKRISEQKRKKLASPQREKRNTRPVFEELDYEAPKRKERVQEPNQRRRTKKAKSNKFVRGRCSALPLPKLSNKKNCRRRRKRKKSRRKNIVKVKAKEFQKKPKNVEIPTVKKKKRSIINSVTRQRKRIPPNSHEMGGLHRDDVVDMSVTPMYSFSSFDRDAFFSDHLRRNCPDIDKHALRVSRKFQSQNPNHMSLPSLIHLLFDATCINSSLDKFRVIYRFIAEIMVYRLNHSHPHDAMPLLRRGYGQCCDYARCFKSLCDGSKILRCRVVDGFSKGTGYMVGDDLGETPDETNHSWNMIQVNRKWVLCDLTWSAGSGDVHEFSDRYWCVPPRLFITDHYPDNPKYQLLEIPKSFTWFGTSCLKMGEEGIECVDSVSHPKPLIHVDSTSETLTLAIRFREGVKVTGPELEFVDYSSPRTITITRLSKNKTWIEYDPKRRFHVISVMFPKAGVYHLEIFAKKGGFGEVNVSSTKYGQCFKYKVQVKSSMGMKSPFLGFPFRYGVEKWYQIVKPYQGSLEAGNEYEVIINADPGQWNVLRIGKSEIYYDEDRMAFVGKITPREGEGRLTVFAYEQKYGSGEGLFQFNVV